MYPVVSTLTVCFGAFLSRHPQQSTWGNGGRNVRVPTSRCKVPTSVSQDTASSLSLPQLTDSESTSTRHWSPRKGCILASKMVSPSRAGGKRPCTWTTTHTCLSSMHTRVCGKPDQIFMHIWELKNAHKARPSLIIVPHSSVSNCNPNHDLQ